MLPPSSSVFRIPSGFSISRDLILPTTPRRWSEEEIMDGASSRDLNPHSTLEEEAKKRNTDCVYFLASPLTCIKGADCEFRHSEVARVNPRDCWFWRNGNCLNPKCAFRHPPLDGFRGNSAPPSSSVSRPAFPPAATLTHFPSFKLGAYQPSANSNRQNTPCYYFQKGTCLKGDKCAFMHRSQPGGDSTSSQAAETIPASDSQPIKETMNGTEDSFLQQENPYRDNMQPVQIPSVVKANSKAGHASSAPEEKMLINGGDKSKTHIQDTMLVCGGNTFSTHYTHQAQVHDAQVQNGKDVDECLGESSPGFDVLVDDDVEESEYFDTDTEEGLSHSRRHLRSIGEFDYIASSMDPLGVFESDPPDAYRRNHNLYGWEQSHASTECDLEIPSSEERKVRLRENSRDVANGQDLRHHLSKRRRTNGSAISSRSDHHGDLWRRDDKLERHHRHSHQERAQHFNVESSISKRLKGRIKFPDNHSQAASSERDLDMITKRRQMRRLSSPSRSVMHREKDSNKARERPKDSVSSEGKGFGGQTHCKGEERKESLNFAGPKSLAELRSAKISETRKQSSVSFDRQVLRRHVVDGEDEKNVEPRKFSSQDSSAQFSFEGPKPLGVILKRKQDMASSDGCGSKNADEYSQIERSDEASESMNMQNSTVQPSEILEESNNGVHSPNYIQNIEGKLDSTSEVYSVLNDELPLQTDWNAQVEDGSMLGMHDQHAENLDVIGEFDDAGSEGRNCTDENPDEEDEYLEDEDGDDFARKLGVMFS